MDLVPFVILGVAFVGGYIGWVLGGWIQERYFDKDEI